jgi:hypothetical protein
MSPLIKKITGRAPFWKHVICYVLPDLAYLNKIFTVLEGEIISNFWTKLGNSGHSGKGGNKSSSNNKKIDEWLR